MASSAARPSMRPRLAAALRTEAGLVRIAIALVALHVLDDAFIQPNPGTSAGDHLAGGVVPVALLAAGAALYGRVRPGWRAVIAVVAGLAGLVVGIEGAYYTSQVGPSGDDYTGLVSIAAGLVLLGVAGVTLWRSRRTDDRVWWRWSRRALYVGAGYLVVQVLVIPTAVGYVVTHTARAHVPEADLGAPYEDVAFRTSDGLTLKGWYVRSRNGAAVISFPGRAGTRKQARLLARHGYGVLLFDRRGEGQSEGDPNAFGWHGARDVHAAVAFLQTQPDVDPRRIGAIGLSVGGEMLIEAATETHALKAIVSEGASGRSVRDDLANDAPWQDVLGDGVAAIAVAVSAGDVPPPTLQSLVPKIRGAVFFVYGGKGQKMEEPANRAFFARARGPKQLWEVPGASHVGGIDARPAEYERRVVGFFDRYLLDAPTAGRASP